MQERTSLDCLASVPQEHWILKPQRERLVHRGKISNSFNATMDLIMQLKEKDGGDGIKMPLDALLHADERTRDALPIGSLRNGLNQRSRPSSMTGF